MTGIDRVLVVGATGRIGRLVVASALEHGLTPRALVRDTAKAARVLPDGVDIVSGDLTEPATLLEANRDVDAVVFTHGSPSGSYERVDYGGVLNVVRALGDNRPRIALMTSIHVTHQSHPAGELLGWKRRSERIVRASRLPYTIVRPSWFEDSRREDVRAVLAQGDTSDGSVSTELIADVLVESLTAESARNRTFELCSAPGHDAPGTDLFAGLVPDEPGALDGAKDRTIPLADEPPHVRQDFEQLRDR